MNCVKIETCTKIKVAHKHAANFKQLFKYFISERAEYTAPLLHLCVRWEMRRGMGIKSRIIRFHGVLIILFLGRASKTKQKKTLKQQTLDSFNCVRISVNAHNSEGAFQCNLVKDIHISVTSVCEFDK